MLILAIDTSTLAGSVAIFRDGEVVKTTGEESGETYSSRMFRHLRMMLEELQLSLDRFDAYAVVSGPGSFTGLRVGLAAVKGWAEIYQRPIVAASALEVVAAMIESANEFVVPVIDARRGQIYFGVYASGGECMRKVAEEQVSTPTEFIRWLEVEGYQRYQGKGLVFASPMAGPLRTFLENSSFASCRVAATGPFLAGTLARLAAVRLARGETITALELDANYVRRSNAELLFPKLRERQLITRAFEQRDVPAVFDLERATVEAAHWPRSEYERLAGSSPLALVTEEANGAIVGFLFARRAADEVEILNLTVCDRVRRKGVASALLDRLFEKLTAAPPARIYLEVRRSNKAAIAFYERHGFGRVGERRNYYSHPTEDALVLSLSINRENLAVDGRGPLC